MWAHGRAHEYGGVGSRTVLALEDENITRDDHGGGSRHGLLGTDSVRLGGRRRPAVLPAGLLTVAGLLSSPVKDHDLQSHVWDEHTVTAASFDVPPTVCVRACFPDLRCLCLCPITCLGPTIGDPP